jgi:hypothetical protein
MTTVYVQLNSSLSAIITEYGCHQSVTSDKPNYYEFDSSDARYVAWQAYLSAQQAYNAALAAGIAITSTGTSSLNGTYACDKGTQQNIVAEQVYISNEGTFTNGGTTMAWPDVSGTYHTFPSTTEFTAFAKAVAQYVQALATALAVVRGGGSWSAPSNAYTIA